MRPGGGIHPILGKNMPKPPTGYLNEFLSYDAEFFFGGSLGQGQQYEQRNKTYMLKKNSYGKKSVLKKKKFTFFSK